MSINNDCTVLTMTATAFAELALTCKKLAQQARQTAQGFFSIEHKHTSQSHENFSRVEPESIYSSAGPAPGISDHELRERLAPDSEETTASPYKIINTR